MEQRPGTELELALLVTVDIRTDQVGGQQVGRELDAVEVALDGLGQRLHRGGLGQSRHPLHQQVAFTHQADQHAVDEVVLADDARGQVAANAIQQGGIQTAPGSGISGIGQGAFSGKVNGEHNPPACRQTSSNPVYLARA